MQSLRLGDILKESGDVTEQQIQDAVAYQKTHKGVRIGGALMALGYIDESRVLQALGKRMDLPVIDIALAEVQIGAVLKIPRPLAEKYEMLGVSIDGNTLTLLTNDPLNFYGIEDVRQVTGMRLHICLCKRDDLLKAIQYYYSEAGAIQAAAAANESFKNQVVEEEEEIHITDEADNEDTPIINLLNRLIHRAYSTAASDIHIEPFEKETTVRMRVDGAIVDYVTLEKSLHMSLIARIKILGGMDIAERRIPQDGHFRTKIKGEYVNLRVSVIPTVFGEKAVLRLLSSSAVIDHSTTFGMVETDYAKLEKMLQSPNGILYFTEPDRFW